MMKGSGFVAASLLFFVQQINAQATIFHGTGFGTYYYDVEQVNACNTSFAGQNTGPVECNQAANLSLDQINSNNIVAMNSSQLSEDLNRYCGKRVIVSANGRPLNLPLFIGDGCLRCAGGSPSIWDPNSAPGLDFSYSILNELSASACADGHISVSWVIMDETLYHFDTNVSQTSQASPDGTCATGAWQCNGRVIEQCLIGAWVPRATCATSMICQGDSNPYCTTPEFGDTP